MEIILKIILAAAQGKKWRYFEPLISASILRGSKTNARIYVKLSVKIPIDVISRIGAFLLSLFLRLNSCF